jgi:hypothetical protein
MEDSSTVHGLAKFFRGLSVAFGVTTLPDNAPPEKQKNFVLAWLGIMAFFIVWIVILIYIFTS